MQLLAMGMLLRLFVLFIAFTFSNCDADKEYCNFGRESFTLFQNPPKKVMNINYDGLHDALLVHDSINGLVIKYVSTTGDFPQYSVTLQHSGFCVGGDVFTADITGDKKDEIICRDANGGFSAKINYNGKWDRSTHIASGFTCELTLTVRFGNFDGAGGEDILCIDPTDAATDTKMFFFRSCMPSYSSANLNDEVRFHNSLYHQTNGYARQGHLDSYHPLAGHLNTYHGNDYAHFHEQHYRRYKRHTSYTLNSYYGRDNTNSACGTGTARVDIDTATFLGDCNTGSTDEIIVMDFNNDKIDDIVCVSNINAGVYKLASTGLSTTGNVFNAAAAIDGDIQCGPNSANSWVMEATDIDGDGDKDFTCVRPNANSLQAYLFFNDGSGGFKNNHKIDDGAINCLNFCNWPVGQTEIAIGDYNHDGNEDLMCRRNSVDLRFDIVYSSNMLTVTPAP